MCLSQELMAAFNSIPALILACCLDPALLPYSPDDVFQQT
jgi:hypothetical protein